MEITNKIFYAAVKSGVEQAMHECELTIGMTLKEAVEKQIPKKPLPDDRYYGVGRCPYCNATFLSNLTNYCGNCGQALDWGQEV